MHKRTRVLSGTKFNLIYSVYMRKNGYTVEESPRPTSPQPVEKVVPVLYNGRVVGRRSYFIVGRRVDSKLKKQQKIRAQFQFGSVRHFFLSPASPDSWGDRRCDRRSILSRAAEKTLPTRIASLWMRVMGLNIDHSFFTSSFHHIHNCATIANICHMFI